MNTDIFDIFNAIIARLGELMDKDNPYEELGKMIVLEYSMNPENVHESYQVVMESVIEKLVSFYEDEELSKLWNNYRFFQSMDEPDAA